MPVFQSHFGDLHAVLDPETGQRGCAPCTLTVSFMNGELLASLANQSHLFFCSSGAQEVNIDANDSFSFFPSPLNSAQQQQCSPPGLWNCAKTGAQARTWHWELTCGTAKTGCDHAATPPLQLPLLPCKQEFCFPDMQPMCIYNFGHMYLSTMP